jgi:outer membrane protein assembly factor BamB
VYPGTSLSGNVVSSEGRFYFQTHSGRVVAVDAASGAVRWDTNLAGNALTTGFGLTLAGETLIATLKYLRASATGRDTGIVAALDAATGAVRWRVVIDPDSVTESGVVHPAVVWGNNVIVVTFSHEVFSFDLTTGAVRWRFDAAYGEPRVGNGGLAGCDGRVIVPTGDLGLVALDAATGAVLWKLPDIKEGSLSWVYCSHGTVLAGRLRVFAALSGASLARYPYVSAYELDPGFWITNVTRDAESIYFATTHGFAKIRSP